MDLRQALPKLLPTAIAWAEARAKRALDVGVPLTPSEQEVARAVGVIKPELVRVEILERLPLPEDAVLRATALQAGTCLPVSYIIHSLVIEVRQTETYAQWFEGLRDRQARARIDGRIRRLSLGNPGDVKPVGEGVSELRIDYGPGYRVYYVQRGQALVILLAGGDKRTQDRDIKTAIELARGL